MSMNVVYQLKYVGQGQCVFYAKWETQEELRLTRIVLKFKRPQRYTWSV